MTSIKCTLNQFEKLLNKHTQENMGVFLLKDKCKQEVLVGICDGKRYYVPLREKK